ncbi:hypothetical protein EJ110_NYTH48453 [Nymphaea thermarum]|nr:hypothetical protein EJ110_NYTH48453 [Nymphaea thermarum]
MRHLIELKKLIKTASKDKKKKYKPYWKIIDRSWNRNLHDPIYATAAFLNPHLFWNKMVKMDEETWEKAFLRDVEATCLHVPPPHYVFFFY